MKFLVGMSQLLLNPVNLKKIKRDVYSLKDLGLVDRFDFWNIGNGDSIVREVSD